jgi:hypothetical protein
MKKPLIRIVKRAQRVRQEVQSETGFPRDSNKWSQAVRSWVAEFQKNARDGSPPAFDRLFQSTRRLT